MSRTDQTPCWFYARGERCERGCPYLHSNECREMYNVIGDALWEDGVGLRFQQQQQQRNARAAARAAMGATTAVSKRSGFAMPRPAPVATPAATTAASGGVAGGATTGVHSGRRPQSQLGYDIAHHHRHHVHTHGYDSTPALMLQLGHLSGHHQQHANSSNGGADRRPLPTNHARHVLDHYNHHHRRDPYHDDSDDSDDDVPFADVAAHFMALGAADFDEFDLHLAGNYYPPRGGTRHHRQQYPRLQHRHRHRRHYPAGADDGTSYDELSRICEAIGDVDVPTKNWRRWVLAEGQFRKATLEATAARAAAIAAAATTVTDDEVSATVCSVCLEECFPAPPPAAGTNKGSHSGTRSGPETAALMLCDDDDDDDDDDVVFIGRRSGKRRQRASAELMPHPLDTSDRDAVEKVVQLPCKHTLHEACAAPYLDKKHTCPVCRKELND